MISPHSHSSAGYRSLTPIQAPPEAQCHQDEQGPFWSSTLHPARRGDEGFLQSLRENKRWWRKVKIHSRSSRLRQDRHWKQPPYKKQALSILPPNPPQNYRSMERFTPLKLLINKVFNTFKYQPWVRCPKPIQHNPSLFRSEEYCSYMNVKSTPLLGPPKVPKRAHPTRLPQRVSSLSKQFPDSRTQSLLRSGT